MKLDFPDIARASRLAVLLAIVTLERRGAVGEAARARVMSDRWIDDARLLMTSNATKLVDVSTLRVVRQLSAAIRVLILRAEIASRKGAA